MGFPKGASIPFGQGRGQYPAREVASFNSSTVDFLKSGPIGTIRSGVSSHFFEREPFQRAAALRLGFHAATVSTRRWTIQSFRPIAISIAAAG